MILTFLCVSSAICKHLVECKKWSWSRNKFASIIELQCFDVCRCPNTQMISSSIWRSFWERSLCFHPFWIKFHFLENCQRFLLKISHSLSALCFDGKTYESSSVYYLPGANMFDVCRKYSMNKYKHFSIRNRSLIRPKLIHVCTRNRFFLISFLLFNFNCKYIFWLSLWNDFIWTDNTWTCREFVHNTNKLLIGYTQR